MIGLKSPFQKRSKPEEVTLTDKDRLLRRVFPDPHPSYIRPDGSITSFAFRLKRGERGLSVDLERLTTYSKSIQDVSRFRLYALTKSKIEQHDLEFEYNPLPDNVAHSLITGAFTKPVCRSLASSTVRVHSLKL